MPGRSQHHAAYRSGKQAGFLRHAHADHRHEDNAERRKAGEIVHQPGEDAANPVGIHQADGADHAVFGNPGRPGRARILHRQPHPAKQAGQKHDAEGQVRKQRDRMWQEVAEPFDPVEEAGECILARRRILSRRIGHLCLLIASHLSGRRDLSPIPGVTSSLAGANGLAETSVLFSPYVRLSPALSISEPAFRLPWTMPAKSSRRNAAAASRTSPSMRRHHCCRSSMQLPSRLSSGLLGPVCRWPQAGFAEVGNA